MNPDWCSKVWCCLLAVSPCNKTRARWAEFLDSARSDCILLRTQLTFFVVWRQNLLRVTFEEENIINFFVKTTFESDVIYNGTSLLIHNSKFLVIRKYILFSFGKNDSMKFWRKREVKSNICGYIRFQWICMGCWNYFFLAIILCFWERERKNAFEKKTLTV